MAQQPRRLRGVGIDLARAYVLDHPDAGECVERRVSKLAVVGDANLDLVVEARVGDQPTSQLGLRGRQRHADDLNAVALCCVDREASPAAADVEHALTGLELELSAHELELGLLGGRERLRPPRQDRATVGHRRIEEQREELFETS